MRDILRWLLHWFSAGAAVEPQGNLDVEVYDRPKYTIAIRDEVGVTVTISDRTRGI